MATIVQIDGVGKVELDDSFKSLSPTQQQSTVDEIANHHAASSAAAPPEKPGFFSTLGSSLAEPIVGAIEHPLDTASAIYNLPTNTLRGIAKAGVQAVEHPIDTATAAVNAAKTGAGYLRGLGQNIRELSPQGPSGYKDESGNEIPLRGTSQMTATPSEKEPTSEFVQNPFNAAAMTVARHPYATALTLADPLVRAGGAGFTGVAKAVSAPKNYILRGERAATPVLQSMGRQLGPEAYNATLETVTAQSAKAANAAKMLEAAEKAKADAIAARGSIATAAGASAEEAKAKAAEAFANAPNRVLEAGQEATGIAPPLARPAVLARISAGKAGVDPLFKESFGPKSTAPLKDQYENAFNDASRNAKVAQQELADAENSHTQLLAKANDQTSVYGINPGQIRASEKTIEAASEKAAAAAEEADRVKTDLGSIQGHILEGKQGAVYTPRISILLENPKVKSGISRGVRIIQNEADAKGEIPSFKDLSIKIDRQGKPILDKNGDVQPIGVPNTRTLHVAKRGLDAFVNSRKDDFGRIVYDAEGEVKSIQDMSKTLSSEMRRVNPTYDKAMSESEKYLKTRTGFIKGAKSVFDDKLPESDFKDILGRMSQEERDAAIESVSNFANETVRKAAPEAGAKVPLASVSRRSEAKLAMLVGDENASNYMAALRGARPSAKGAALATGKSPALKVAGENIQAAENTAKGLRKDVTASNQELAKALKLSNKMKIRQVFYDTAPLEEIGKRAAKDLESDMDAGRITHDQYESSIRALKTAEKDLGKTQGYRNAVKTVTKGALKAVGLAAGLRMGGVGLEHLVP
jgi:hypothetical protein